MTIKEGRTMIVDLDWLEQEIVLAVTHKYPEARDRNRRIVAIVDALSDIAGKHGASILVLVAINDIRMIHERLKAKPTWRGPEKIQ